MFSASASSHLLAGEVPRVGEVTHGWVWLEGIRTIPVGIRRKRLLCAREGAHDQESNSRLWRLQRQGFRPSGAPSAVTALGFWAFDRHAFMTV